MAGSRDDLREAVERGDLSTVKRLLHTEPGLLHESIPPCNDRRQRGQILRYRPMTLAAVECQTEILSFLIAEGGDVMEYSNFPLCRASLYDRCIPTLELLVQHGAEVNRVGNDYGPPLIFACEGMALDCMAWLLDNGAAITGTGPSLSETVSWNALKHAGFFNRKCSGMLDLLLEHGADVNSSVVDEVGGDPETTVLHNVAESGDIAGVELLLTHGADQGAKNGKGQRPVEVARERKVRELLENV